MPIGPISSRQQIDAKFRDLYTAQTQLDERYAEFVKQMGDSNRDDTWLKGLGYNDDVQEPNNGNLTEVEQVNTTVASIDHLVKLHNNEASQAEPTDLLFWLRKAAGIT